MPNTTNAKELPQQEVHNTSYHDKVENFDLLYKITPVSEKSTPLLHYHECYEIVFYISADVEIYVDNLHFTLSSRDLIIIPPRKLHKVISRPSQTYIRYVFYFTSEQINQAFRNSSNPKSSQLFKDNVCCKLSLPAQAYMRMNNVFHNMYEHKTILSYKNSDLLNTYASAILQEAIFLSEKYMEKELTADKSSPIDQILQYINDHYSENITLDILETKFYMDKSYICRLFQKTMGISVINYLQYRRIMEAQQLLLNSDLPIIDICMDCGFNNVQHFYRVFKKITNLTPTEYKKHLLSTHLGQALSFPS